MDFLDIDIVTFTFTYNHIIGLIIMIIAIIGHFKERTHEIWMARSRVTELVSKLELQRSNYIDKIDELKYKVSGMDPEFNKAFIRDQLLQDRLYEELLSDMEKEHDFHRLEFS